MSVHLYLIDYSRKSGAIACVFKPSYASGLGVGYSRLLDRTSMHKRPARLGLLLILLVSIAWYTIKNPSWPLLSLWRAGRPQPSLKSTSSFTKALVCGRRGQDDTQWIKDLSPGWESYIYAVDDPLAELTVSDNHGFEASFYLTFIIDHYHDLPDVVVFLHGQRYQWHNDDAVSFLPY